MIKQQFSSIHPGTVYKNYKELCEAIGEKPKAGDSKRKQLREIEKWLKLRKEGWTYTVEEVYETKTIGVSNLPPIQHKPPKPKRGRPRKIKKEKPMTPKIEPEQLPELPIPIKTDAAPISRIKIGQVFPNDTTFYDFLGIDYDDLSPGHKRQVKKAIKASIEWKEYKNGKIEITDVRSEYLLFNPQCQSIPNFLFLKPGDEVAIYFCKVESRYPRDRVARKGIVKEILPNGYITVESKPIVPEERTEWIFDPQCWCIHYFDVHLFLCTPDFEEFYDTDGSKYLKWYAKRVLPNILPNMDTDFLRTLYQIILQPTRQETEEQNE
jgi:hypothetical protein